MPDLATVTSIKAKPHSWRVEARAGDPKRHIRTCKRDGCRIQKRSEYDEETRDWYEVWRWVADDQHPASRVYDNRVDGKVPACGTPEPVSPVGGTDPAPVPPPVAASTTAVPAETPPCSHHRPPLDPCGLPTRLYTSGWACIPAAVAASRARAEHLAALRSATSGMGVPSWRGAA